MEELESEVKVPGKKRKTVLYWKGILKQAGLDYTRIDMLTKDRKEWKAIVNERMRHLEKWERRRGKKVLEESGNRDVVIEEEVGFICEVCRKVCKNKAGLTVHRRRMHGRSDQKVTFKCDICALEFIYAANLRNHKRSCTGVPNIDPDLRVCGKCGKSFSKSNIARHKRSCGDQPPPHQQLPEMVDAPHCSSGAESLKKDKTFIL